MASTETDSAIDWAQCELIECVPGKVSGRILDDSPAPFGYTDRMEVHPPPDVESKLASFANRRGIDAQAPARAAIERFVENGLDQIDRGQVLTHEAVGECLECH